MSSEQLARVIAGFADDKKATDLVGLRVGDLVGYTDVLIVCTAANERQAKAIHDEVHERLKHDYGLLPERSEGLPEATWVLLDYADCILHIFIAEARDRYRLDQLWGEAERLELGLEPSGDPVRRPA